MENRPRDWLTFKEAANEACVSIYSLRRYLKLRKNKPPFYKLVPNGRLRFPRDEFMQWVGGKTQKEK